MSHSHVRTPRLAQEIPGEGLLSQSWPCHPSLGMHTTCHQPFCSPCSGRGLSNSRHRRPAPGLVHPILLSPRVSPMALIHPQPSRFGVRVQPQCWGGDLWHLHHGGHILKPTHPSLEVPDPHREPGRGRDRARKGVGLWVDMVGEDRGCTSRG